MFYSTSDGILTSTVNFFKILSPPFIVFTTNSIGISPMCNGMIVNGIAIPSFGGMVTSIIGEFFPASAMEQNLSCPFKYNLAWE